MKKVRGKKLVIANWKMNPLTIAEAKKLFLQIKKVGSRLRDVQTVVCAPFVYLAELRKLYVGHKVALGAQDVHWKEQGSYTGDVSAPMLRSVGADFVIIGHSERRAQGETDEIVQKKIVSAIDEKLTAVVCFGEAKRDKGGAYLGFLRGQLESIFARLASDQLRHIIVVYEPIWAIGKSARDALLPEDMHEMVLFVRKFLVERFGDKDAHKTPVLYGGSVEPENAAALLERGAADGFLVGHASLDAQSFQHILETANVRR